MLAQFISEAESLAPGRPHVAGNLLEALYEFGSGSQSASPDNIHSPLLLLSAHRAKGLEFDHVLVMDVGGWHSAKDDERRLFYVAMTRARKSLTLCARRVRQHPFVRDCEALCLTSRPEPEREIPPLTERGWLANPSHIVLSWPGYFAADNPIHQAIAELDYGCELILRRRNDGKPGWELADKNGTVVGRMAQAFRPPEGKILSVRVAVILTRFMKPEEQGTLKVEAWELVIPEIRYEEIKTQTKRSQ
ncbi:ATP-binding domain-containing protein [Methylomonas sp. MgM2]